MSGSVSKKWREHWNLKDFFRVIQYMLEPAWNRGMFVLHLPQNCTGILMYLWTSTWNYSWIMPTVLSS